MSTVEALTAERDALALRYEELRGEHDRLKVTYQNVLVELEKLRRHIFGRKAETIDPAQASLAFQLVFGLVTGTTTGTAAAGTGESDASSTAPEDTPPPSSSEQEREKPAQEPKKKVARPHGRRPKLPGHLPVERIELMPPEVTEGNRHLYELLPEAVSETVAWRAASAVRVQVVRLKVVLRRSVAGATNSVDSVERNDRTDDAVSTPVGSEKTETTGAPKILIAPMPDWVIPRCLAAPSMLAHVLVQKYCYHIPLHRMERMFAHQGLDLSRSTLCGWVETSANLLKVVVDAMAKDALNAPWIGIDATGVLVQAKEQCRRCHFWVMVAARDHVLFRFSARHVKEAPRDFLKGYRGYVQADASSVYELLYRTEDVTEVACHAHARRHFYDALGNDKERALAGIGFINQLFEIERALKELPPSRRREERLRRSTPILDAFDTWVDEESPKVVPKTPIAGALGYAKNQRIPLRRFLEDGRLRIDNNLSELELRRQKVGAKNWLFLGSDDGAEWNTTVVSLIASCELHKLDPYAYLHEVLSVIQPYPKANVLDLAPKYWRQTRERLLAEGKLVGEGIQTAPLAPNGNRSGAD